MRVALENLISCNGNDWLKRLAETLIARVPEPNSEAGPARSAAGTAGYMASIWWTRWLTENLKFQNLKGLECFIETLLLPSPAGK